MNGTYPRNLEILIKGCAIFMPKRERESDHQLPPSFTLTTSYVIVRTYSVIIHITYVLPTCVVLYVRSHAGVHLLGFIVFVYKHHKHQHPIRGCLKAIILISFQNIFNFILVLMERESHKQ